MNNEQKERIDAEDHYGNTISIPKKGFFIKAGDTGIDTKVFKDGVLLKDVMAIEIIGAVDDMSAPQLKILHLGQNLEIEGDLEVQSSQEILTEEHKKDLKFLKCLEKTGVENWEGWDKAVQMSEENS